MNLVETLFEPLDDAGVNYCLLRNYDFLEGGSLDNDIDVLLLSNQRDLAESVLADLGFEKCRGEPTQHTFYLRMRTDELAKDILHVCWDDVQYNTLPVADGDRIIENRVKHDSTPVWVPADEDAFVQLTFHSILNRGSFKDAYEKRLAELAETMDTETVNNHAQDLYGRLGRRTIEIVRRGDFEPALEMKWRLVLTSAVRHPKRVPRFLYVLLVYYQLRRPITRWNRRYNPLSPTPTIALLGPDGSGKSTLSKRLTADLQKMGVDAGRVELGIYNGQTRFIRLLQRLNNVLTGYDLESDKRDRRAGALSLDARNGLLKSTLYFLDQMVRYLQANASGHDVLVADRYLQDVVLYHHPVFTRLLPWFENEQVLTFVLDADSDVIAERSEYERGSIDEMRERLSILDSDRIDVSKSLAEIRTELRQRIARSAFVKYLK